MDYLAELLVIEIKLKKLAITTCVFPKDLTKITDAYDKIIEHCERAREGWRRAIELEKI